MKICFIGNAGHINLISWIRGLTKVSDNEINILTFNEPSENLDGVQVQTIGPLFRGSKLRYILAIPEVRKLVNRIKPDILIGYRINSYGLLAVSAGWHPVVLIAQGSDIFYKDKFKINKMILNYVLRRADLIHTWEIHMRDKLLEYGAHEKKIFMLPKGVDTDIFRPSDCKKQKDSYVLISTRQLHKSYNQVCILKALPLVSQSIPHFQYLICGDGEYKNELQNIADSLEIGNHVKFLGRINHQLLPSLLGSSDIYISMQPSDGVSASLLEAMACGVFPIVTDIQANRYWIDHGVNGFLVKVNDHQTLAKSIVSALGNQKLRDEAKERNLKLINERGSMRKNAEKTIEMYSKVISDFKKSSSC